ARVAPVELDEGLGVSRLEIEHEHAVVQVHVGAAALGGCVSHVGNADDHSYPANETSGKGLGCFEPPGLVGASLRTSVRASATTGSTLAWGAGRGSEAHDESSTGPGARFVPVESGGVPRQEVSASGIAGWNRAALVSRRRGGRRGGDRGVSAAASRGARRHPRVVHGDLPALLDTRGTGDGGSAGGVAVLSADCGIPRGGGPGAGGAVPPPGRGARVLRGDGGRAIVPGRRVLHRRGRARGGVGLGGDRVAGGAGWAGALGAGPCEPSAGGGPRGLRRGPRCRSGRIGSEPL